MPGKCKISCGIKAWILVFLIITIFIYGYAHLTSPYSKKNTYPDTRRFFRAWYYIHLDNSSDSTEKTTTELTTLETTLFPESTTITGPGTVTNTLLIESTTIKDSETTIMKTSEETTIKAPDKTTMMTSEGTTITAQEETTTEGLETTTMEAVQGRALRAPQGRAMKPPKRNEMKVLKRNALDPPEITTMKALGATTLKAIQTTTMKTLGATTLKVLQTTTMKTLGATTLKASETTTMKALGATTMKASKNATNAPHWRKRRKKRSASDYYRNPSDKQDPMHSITEDVQKTLDFLTESYQHGYDTCHSFITFLENLQERLEYLGQRKNFSLAHYSPTGIKYLDELIEVCPSVLHERYFLGIIIFCLLLLAVVFIITKILCQETNSLYKRIDTAYHFLCGIAIIVGTALVIVFLVRTREICGTGPYLHEEFHEALIAYQIYWHKSPNESSLYVMMTSEKAEKLKEINEEFVPKYYDFLKKKTAIENSELNSATTPKAKRKFSWSRPSSYNSGHHHDRQASLECELYMNVYWKAFAVVTAWITAILYFAAAIKIIRSKPDEPRGNQVEPEVGPEPEASPPVDDAKDSPQKDPDKDQADTNANTSNNNENTPADKGENT